VGISFASALLVCLRAGAWIAVVERLVALAKEKGLVPLASAVAHGSVAATA